MPAGCSCSTTTRRRCCSASRSTSSARSLRANSARASTSTTPEGEPIRRRDTPSGVAFFEQRPAHQTVVATAYNGVRRTYEATAYPLLGTTGEMDGVVAVFWADTSGPTGTPATRRLMQARVWGCRGSVAAPGPDTVKYGGNTSCVEVRLESGHVLVLDAGTGMRPLGVAMQGRPAGRAPHAAHAPAPGPSPGSRLLPAAVRARSRHPHLGTDVAGAAPRRAHRAPTSRRRCSPCASTSPLAPHVPRRARAAASRSARRPSGPRRSRTRARRSATASRRTGRSLVYLPDHEPSLGARSRHGAGRRG